MVKSLDQCFQKPKMTSLQVLFCPQPKDDQFSVTEEINQNMFTFRTLESEKLLLVVLE